MLRFKTAAPALARLSLITVIVAFASVGSAAVINYGDFGPDFPPGVTIYQDVQESSGTDPVPLFGQPEIDGNRLDFDPQNFVASATDGLADITDGQLNFVLRAVPGAGITTLLTVEEGDFTLFGSGTDLTSVAAGVSVRVEILEVDGVALASPISIFASNSITRGLVSDGPVVLAPWSNAVLVDFGTTLVANQVPFQLGVTKANVVVDNSLLAISEDDSAAFIAKKDFYFEPSTVGVPEPASMSVLALGGLALLRKRR